MGIRGFWEERIRKNRQEFLGLAFRYYPGFVFSRAENPPSSIPVFHFHAISEEAFESRVGFLHRNGYQTLTADEFLECSRSGNVKNRVLLTFDDGLASLQEVALPILRKLGMKAVCFLIPGLVEEIAAPDSQTGAAPPRTRRERLLTWDEIRRIHQTGIVDFQSHSLFHECIFTGSRLSGFVTPGFDSSFGYSDIPRSCRVARGGRQEVAYGTPLYPRSSRFSGRLKFTADDAVRDRCISFVESEGGEVFFARRDWRSRLKKVHRQALSRARPGTYETEPERREAIRSDLESSRKTIESRLGKSVCHFCYPWYDGCDLATDLAKETGYQTNFWGVLPPGGGGFSPFRIPRVPDHYIQRLPGMGRRSLGSVLYQHYLSRIRKGGER